MYLEIIKLLKDGGIKFDAGLTQSELEKIYEIYKIKFPLSLKSFLTTALPVSDGFYDWRDFFKCKCHENKKYDATFL